jgi:hypothetical protein
LYICTISAQRETSGEPAEIPDVINYYLLDNHLVVLIILLVGIGNTPLLRDNDLLATRELVSSTSECFNDGSGIRILCADGEDYLANIDTTYSPIGFPPSAIYASLQTISLVNIGRSQKNGPKVY